MHEEVSVGSSMTGQSGQRSSESARGGVRSELWLQRRKRLVRIGRPSTYGLMVDEA